MKLTRSREWNEIEGIFLNFLLFWYKYEPFAANSSPVPKRFVTSAFHSTIYKFMRFEKISRLRNCENSKIKLRNLLQLLYYKTIKILALTLGKWGSPPSHINTTVHNEHLTLWHETTEPVRLTRLPHPILGPIHFLSLARAPLQPLLSIIV